MIFDTPIDLCRKCYFEIGNGTQHDPSHKWMQVSMQMCTDAAQTLEFGVVLSVDGVSVHALYHARTMLITVRLDRE